MGSSDRVLNGSKIKGSTAILLGSEYTQELADGYAQGYNVQDFGLLSDSMTFKIRSNAGVVRTLEGVDMDTSKFNDDYSPINHTAFSLPTVKATKTLTVVSRTASAGDTLAISDGHGNTLTITIGGSSFDPNFSDSDYTGSGSTTVAVTYNTNGVSSNTLFTKGLINAVRGAFRHADSTYKIDATEYSGTTTDLVLTNTAPGLIGNDSNIQTGAGDDIADDLGISAGEPGVNLSGGKAEPAGSVRIPSPNLKGRESERINHSREQRDLGQTHLYDDGYAFFEAVNTTNGVEIINAVGPQALPASLVDHSSVSALDGKIEPLETISQIDRSTIDHPFNARGIKGSMGIGSDAFLRSYQIDEGFHLPIPGSGSLGFNPATPFLDSVEHMGTQVNDTTRVDIDLPGAFYQDTSKIKPYSDVSSDRENFMIFGPGKVLTNDTGTPDRDISKILVENSKFTVDNTLQNFDKLTNGGFDFSNDLGTDSLVYGGLLKG